MVSFRGQKKLGPRPDRSPSFKISDEHPHPFHMQSPPPGTRLYICVCMSSSFSTTLHGIAWLVVQVVEQPRRHT